MKKIIIASIGMLALTACVGIAEPSKTFMTLAEAEAQAKVDGKTLTEAERQSFELVCKQEKITGSLSRVSTTCLTRNEWRYIQSRTAMVVGRMQGNASGGKECKTDAGGGCAQER